MDKQNLSAQERLARLALYLGLGYNAGHFHKLLRLFGSATELLAAPKGALDGLSLKALMRPGIMDEAVEEEQKALKQGVDLYFFDTPDYPERLTEIPNPPPVLWSKGDLNRGDRLAVAFVGSRTASDWGLKTAHRLAFEAAQAGLTVVSGLAKGIDTAAHKGALEAHGRTIAVSACGVDWVYPVENKKLHTEITHSGAVVSEIPLGIKPSPHLFPRRNRLISGLSLAVVVVEAAEKSGALITAKLALEQNREVLAIPGQGGSPQSQGANRLIKSGAALAETLEDILVEIKPRLLEGLQSNRPLLADIQLKKEPPKILALPNGPERDICLLLEEGPKLGDELIRLSGLEPGQILEILLNLELSGLVARKSNAQYELI